MDVETDDAKDPLDLEAQILSMARPDGLTVKEVRFVQAYLRTWKATEAAREAGYSAATVRAASYLLLRKPAIAAVIAAELKKQEMQAEEVMARLTQQARVNPADFFTFEDVPKKTGGTERRMTGINWSTMETHGYLVKKLSFDRGGRPIIEFHDPQRALELLARRRGLLIDQQRLSGSDGGPIALRWDDGD